MGPHYLGPVEDSTPSATELFDLGMLLFAPVLAALRLESQPLTCPGNECQWNPTLVPRNMMAPSVILSIPKLHANL